MGIQAKLWRDRKADFARNTGHYYKKPDPLKGYQPGTPISEGVKRAAKRLSKIAASNLRIPDSSFITRQRKRAHDRVMVKRAKAMKLRLKEAA